SPESVGVVFALINSYDLIIKLVGIVLIFKPFISSSVVTSLFAVQYINPSNQNLKGVKPFSSYLSASGPYNASLSFKTFLFTSKLSENKNGIAIICDSVITSPDNPGDVIAISIDPVCNDCNTSMFDPN